MVSELTLLFEIIPLCVIKSLNGLCECLNREMDWQENRPVVQLMDLGERTDKSTREWGEMRGVRWAERLCFCQIWEWRWERERTTITSTLTPPVIMGSVSDAMIGRKEEGSDSNRWENMGHNDKNLVWGLAFQSRGEKWGGVKTDSISQIIKTCYIWGHCTNNKNWNKYCSDIQILQKAGSYVYV